MNIYQNFYKNISRQKTFFEGMLALLHKTNKFSDQLEIAQMALLYALTHNTGYFTSAVLENFFVHYAQKLTIDLSGIDYQKNSFLHVLTTGYEHGGHTRVVERWVENAPEYQTHSVVILAPSNAQLSLLQKNVKNKHGQYILYDEKQSLETKALALRKLAMGYQYIILHTHMQDPTATLAFGTKDFTRPVLFYNHASHLFWIGKSISDMVLDLLENDEVTTHRRQITNNIFAGVPSEQVTCHYSDRIQLRKELNLPTDKKIIITSGAAHRYNNYGQKGFLDYVKQILDNDTYLYAIGIDPSNKEWQQAAKETNGHIIPMGYIDFSQGYLKYLQAADLYLDSYPLPGYTAFIDAVSCNVAGLSLKNPFLQLDYLRQTAGYCQTPEELIDKAKAILKDKTYAQKLATEQQASLQKYQSKEAWNSRIQKILEQVPAEHQVKDLSRQTDFSEIDDFVVFVNFVANSQFLAPIKEKTSTDIYRYVIYGQLNKRIGLPFVCTLERRTKGKYKYRILYIFNKPVLQWRKYAN